MGIKKKLQNYVWIKENIQSLEDRLLEIDTQLTKITANLSDDPVQTTKDPDRWTNLINERIEVEEMINRELCRCLKEIQYIEKLIEKLPEREKLLMRLRYIDNLKWEEIAYKMNYTWQHMHRIHAEVLKKIKCDRM